MSVTVTSNYAGEVAGALLSLMKDGNQAIEKGSLYVEPDVKESLYIDRFRVSDDQLQDRAETPSSPSNSITYTEQTITPQDLMFYDTVNPRNFESVWRPYQPEGPLVDRVDNPEIQAAILREVGKSIGKQLGKLVWQGDTAAGASSPLRFFDGFQKLIDNGTGVVDVTPAGAITASNVIAILEACEAAIPSDVWEDPNMNFHMSTTDYRLYQQAARALDYKGAEIADAQEERFAGRRIKYYSGLEAGHIIVAKGTAGRDSNLWAAIDVVGDDQNIKIERYRPESELFIVKALFKFAVNFGNPEEIVWYKPS